MALYISQTHPLFVGEVTRVGLRQPLGPTVVTEIDAGMDRYAVPVPDGRPQGARDRCHPPFLGELTRSGGPVSSRPSTQSRKCPNQFTTVSQNS